MTGPALDALTAALAGPAAALREAALHRRRGRPPPPSTPPAPAPGPRLTLADKLLALILRDRHGLPCTATAALLGVRHELISRHTSDIRRLLRGPPHPARPRKLATLDDLCHHATAHGITVPAKIKPAR